MTAYPTPSDIEVAWRASGTGVCIIVEGETELEDAWFYKHWFDDRARELTFFPQDGWEKVVDAVHALRASLGAKRVYGIIDRDFEEHVAHDPFPSDGIARTAKYTLENYLLDVECWFKYVCLHTRRVSKPGWNTLDEARGTLESLYRECLPLSAYNWVLHRSRQEHPVKFMALPPKMREYKEHPKAIDNLGDVLAHLRNEIQTQMGIADDLGRMYTERLGALQILLLADLEQVVSGKYVLNLLREQFPINLGSRQAWDDVLSAYISLCPDPPSDLETLINLVLQDAHA